MKDALITAFTLLTVSLCFATAAERNGWDAESQRLLNCKEGRACMGHWASFDFDGQCSATVDAASAYLSVEFRPGWAHPEAVVYSDIDAKGPTSRLTIGTRTFDLPTWGPGSDHGPDKGSYAYFYTEEPAEAAENQRLIDAIKLGRQATYSIVSASGEVVTETFSLMGATAMIEDAEQCLLEKASN